MDIYQSEQEQVEALKQWWVENGKSVIAGIVLGLAAIFGWRAWQDHVRLQAEAASEDYQKLMLSLDKPEEKDRAKQLAGDLIKAYDTSAYAIFARMALARLAVEEEEYQVAADHLREALAKNGEKRFEPLIRLRLAGALIQAGDHESALTELETKDPGTYAASYDELRGDIQAALGDVEKARAAYQSALEKYRLQQGDTMVLELKLDNLGNPKL